MVKKLKKFAFWNPLSAVEANWYVIATIAVAANARRATFSASARKRTASLIPSGTAR